MTTHVFENLGGLVPCSRVKYPHWDLNLEPSAPPLCPLQVELSPPCCWNFYYTSTCMLQCNQTIKSFAVSLVEHRQQQHCVASQSQLSFTWVFGVRHTHHLLCVVDRTAMRTFWTRVGIIGPISMAFGSVLWSTKTEADPTSPYDLKLVQVLFRHGARTPLKSIPDVMEVNPL